MIRYILILITLLVTTNLFSQKLVVTDVNSSHAISMQTYATWRYSQLKSGTIDTAWNIAQGLGCSYPINYDSNVANTRLNVIAFSTSTAGIAAGMNARFSDYKQGYGTLIIASHSNNNRERHIRNLYAPVIYISGLTDTSGTNIVSYGPGLQFVVNPTYLGYQGGAQSQATGEAAGLFLALLDTLETVRGTSVSWWEVYWRYRATATRTITTHPSGELWNEFHGWGQPNFAAALAYSGSIPAVDSLSLSYCPLYYYNTSELPAVPGGSVTRLDVNQLKVPTTTRPSSVVMYDSTSNVMRPSPPSTRSVMGSLSTDASGDITVTLPAALTNTNYSVSFQLEGTTLYTSTVHTKTTTTFKVRLFNPTTGVALGTGVSIPYSAIITPRYE